MAPPKTGMPRHGRAASSSCGSAASSDPSVTLRVYAHVIRDQVGEAADIFARSVVASGEGAISKSVSTKAPPSMGKGS
jgi:hypothetical protein